MAKSLASIQKSIRSMSEATAEKDLFAMVYSEFGVGKTTLIMRIAQELRGDGSILFCDSSDGWLALENTPELMESVDLFTITDPADLYVVGNALKAGKLKPQNGGHFTVAVIDELSSVFSVMLEQYLREKHSLGPDEPLPEAEGKEYGPPTAALESIIRKFHEATGVHLLVTGHAREVGEAKEMRPDFSPKAYNAVLRKAHVSAALSARRQKVGGEVQYVRSVQLHPSASVSAKCRIPGAPVKAGEDEFIDLITSWVNGDSFVSDTEGAEDETGLAEDPTEAPEPDTESDDVDPNEPDDEDGESEDAEEMTRAEAKQAYAAAKLGELRIWARETFEISHEGKNKKELIDEILDAQYGVEGDDEQPAETAPDEEPDAAEEEAADESEEAAEEDEEEGDELPTEADLMRMTLAELRTGAEQLDIDPSVIPSKKKLVAAILEAMGA